MTTQLPSTATDSTGKPLSLSVQTHLRITSLFHRLMPGANGRMEMLPEASLTGDERVKFQRRRADLRRALAPESNQKAIEALVGSLLGAMPPGRAPKGDPVQVMRMFVHALQGLPTWAVAGAVAAWNRGVFDKDGQSYAPAPSDLLRAAKMQVEPFGEELHRIGALLDAPMARVETVEDRQRTADRVRQWVKDRTPAPAMEVPLTEQELEAQLSEKMAAWKANPVKPSPYLQALLSRQSEVAPPDMSQVGTEMRG